MTSEIVEIRQIVQLECSACGVAAEGSCNCGAPYLPAKQRAVAAIEASPERSDRAIATELGISPTTVGKARNQLGEGTPVDERIGLDGKTRRMPRTERPYTEDPENFVTAFLLKAEAARDLASDAVLLDVSPTKEIAAAARRAASAWMQLANRLEGKRLQGGRP